MVTGLFILGDDKITFVPAVVPLQEMDSKSDTESREIISPEKEENMNERDMNNETFPANNDEENDQPNLKTNSDE